MAYRASSGAGPHQDDQRSLAIQHHGADFFQRTYNARGERTKEALATREDIDDYVKNPTSETGRPSVSSSPKSTANIKRSNSRKRKLSTDEGPTMAGIITRNSLHGLNGWSGFSKLATDSEPAKYSSTISKDKTSDEDAQRSISLAYLGSKLRSRGGTNSSFKISQVPTAIPSQVGESTFPASAPPMLIPIDSTPMYQSYYNQLRMPDSPFRNRAEYQFRKWFKMKCVAHDSFGCGCYDFAALDRCYSNYQLLNERRSPPIDENKQTSSYWSVPEAEDFPLLLKSFGKNWAAIAAFMGTKNAVMVKNFYNRRKDGTNWEEITEKAGNEHKGVLSPAW